MSLEALIKKRIRAYGSINVADFMELALAHPEYGYYMRRDPLGAQGDFITAPEISQIFGEIIGAWIARQWHVMGNPQIALVELGPGRGTLMADMLRATKSTKGFHDALSVHLVETSPALKQKQWQALAGKHERLHWHERFDALPPLPLLLVANEFFDALPIRQFALSSPSPLEGEGWGGGWCERMISLDEKGNLQFVHSNPSQLPPTLPSPTQSKIGGEGNMVETCEPALAITKQLAAHLAQHGGCALAIDYGYTGGSRGDTLQALKNHQYHDVLQTPGEADLTAHVDFDALKSAATQADAKVYGAVPQGAWLMRLGAGVRLQTLCAANPAKKDAMISGLERIASPDQMGDLFKVLCITHPAHPKPEGF